MREIKFRAWDKQWQAMSTEMKLFVNGQSFFFFKGFGVRGPTHEELVVMQYTGLKDKNGVEIFGGDIVRAGNWEFEVVWQGVGWGLKGVKHGWWRSFSEFESIEIIGNIHEDPKLPSRHEASKKESDKGHG